MLGRRRGDGGTEERNLQLLCGYCNRVKGNGDGHGYRLKMAELRSHNARTSVMVDEKLAVLTGKSCPCITGETPALRLSMILGRDTREVVGVGKFKKFRGYDVMASDIHIHPPPVQPSLSTLPLCGNQSGQSGQSGQTLLGG